MLGKLREPGECFERLELAVTRCGMERHHSTTIFILPCYTHRWTKIVNAHRIRTSLLDFLQFGGEIFA